MKSGSDGGDEGCVRDIRFAEGGEGEKILSFAGKYTRSRACAEFDREELCKAALGVRVNLLPQ